ncbi:hypothetical protein V470_11025 [Streptococcus sp. VT 162]|nr:hypothetical protein V470_11025 [Streptococcus sp. VT 162]
MKTSHKDKEGNEIPGYPSEDGQQPKKDIPGYRFVESSLTWNRFLFASIVEGWLDCFIDWNQWVTTLEGWSARLWNTLRTCAGYVSASWGFFLCLG